jgi:hypothetical protein
MLTGPRRFTMNRVTIDLENCYGIKKLSMDLNFSKDEPIYALYAPNGMMKSCLAQTFQDIADGVDSVDRFFPKRQAKRKIVDGSGHDLTKESVLVIRPYDPNFGNPKKTSTLLADQKLQKEYTQLYEAIDTAKESFLKAIKKQAKSKRDFEQEIAAAFTSPTLEVALGRIEKELTEQNETPFTDVQYDKIFDDRVLEFLGSPSAKNAISTYVNRYNDLLTASTYFKKGTFDYYNGAQIAAALTKNGFFAAKHSVNLNNGGRKEIKTEQELREVIDHEKDSILKDKVLRKAFDDLEKLITANTTLRDFQNYIAGHEGFLSRMENISQFKQDILKSYMKSNFSLYKDLVDKIDAAKVRRKHIEEQAAQQSTEWEAVVQIFTDRFVVPFKLTVNKIDVMLRQQPLQLGFTYQDGTENAPFSQDSLKWLSTGERKAYYILNVIFEIRARQKEKRETIIIMDDIADSFDYQNKYAIIQYLSEIGEEGLFKQIIMTHNFDFFRTLGSRCVNDKHCLMVTKNKDGCSVGVASGIRNAFYWELKSEFFKSPQKKIACIPFLRNLLELREGVSDSGYKDLTALLHWKPDSASIVESDLDAIYNVMFNKKDKVANGKRAMVDVIFNEAVKCLTAGFGVNFENKIVLSIAIRLAAERYMVGKINNDAAVGAITSNQTRKLIKMFKEKFPGESAAIKVIDRVALMTPENIHLNSFMYEPIVDMADDHLRTLYTDVCNLK